MGHLVEITQKHEFSNEDISDLLVSALEGGINYWCKGVEILRNKVANTYAGISEADQNSYDVIGLNGKLELYDIDDDDSHWTLDLPKMLNGIKLYCEANNKSLSDLIDNHDADDADSIIQYALFGKMEFC